jgi:DNA invertase Pin-like site-specific DNA recombinase
MKNKIIEVVEMLEEGFSPREVAIYFGMDVSEVLAIQNELDEEYDDSMDGDAASALASAGWGTDEDYGYYGA